MAKAQETVRVAAVGDLHCGRAAQGSLKELFAEAAARADVLVLCGDLTDYGLPEEAHVLARELTTAGRLPVLAVLGNHDYEAGKQNEVRQIIEGAGVTVLDGDTFEVRGVGFAGAKGFVGGFGPHVLEPWGEKSLKDLIREAVDEALKLEAGLARLRTPQRVAVLHYAPVRDTVEGEPPEIHAFLGCSRLEEPLNRYPLAAVFHGHAHRGKPEGRCRAGAPVYNVALPLLRRAFPDRPPFRVVELAVPARPES